MTSTMRRLGVLVASIALISAGMMSTATAAPVCNAANECGTYHLTAIRQFYGGTVPPDTPVSIDDTHFDALGGYIAFSQRSTDTAGECANQIQHFKFSWSFNRDVTTMAGKSGDALALMSTLWEGDAGTRCLDGDPFVWIHTGGKYGPNETDAVKSDTFKLSFVNGGGENRIYYKGEGSSSPTIVMNWPLYETGGIEILPEIRFFGHPMNIVYAYQRLPDEKPPVSVSGPTVKVRPVLHRGTLKVDIDPNEGAGFWTFQIQWLNPQGTWSTIPRIYRTLGNEETRTINLPAGTYRVMTQPKFGYGVGYSVSVRLLR